MKLSIPICITLFLFSVAATWAGELPGWGPVGISSGCASCNGSGSDQLDVGTIFSINFGPGLNIPDAGALVLRAGAPSPDLATPKNLDVTGLEQSEVEGLVQNEVEVRYDAEGSVKQISTYRIFIDIELNDPYGYTIWVMEKAGQGELSNGWYVRSDNQDYLLRKYVVENPDGSARYNRLRITDVTSGAVWMFTYSTAISGWTVTLPDNLGLLDLISTNQASTAWTLIRRYHDPAGNVVAEHSQVYTNLSWGSVLLSDTVGVGAEARTRQLTYYEDANSAGYTPATDKPAIKTEQFPDGTWRQVTAYDSSGRVLTNLYGIDTGVTSDSSVCRKVVYSYASQDDSDTGSREPNSPRKIDEYWKETLVKRTYHVYTHTAHRTIECPNPNNSIGDLQNLVTEVTFKYEEYEDTTIVSKISYPDGTVSVQDTWTFNDNNTIEIIDQGEPNYYGGDSVVNGTHTEEITTPAGSLVSRNVWRISGGVQGIQIGALTNSVLDEFERPTRVDYLGGLFETMSYACCGLDSKTDKEGVTTAFGYDDLGRKVTETRLDITTQNILDAAGRIIAGQRVGTDTSVITLLGRTYDTSGFVTSETNALSGVTSFARTKTGAGYDIVTTTYPNTGTRIEQINSEGLVDVAGTAVHGKAYGYGAGTDVNGNACTYTVETNLNADGSLSSEWTRTYTDAVGRRTEILYADSHYSQSFYNSLGQLSEQIDPDGATNFYQYNGEGELAYTATAMAGNETGINFGGNDRITWTTNDFITDHGTDVRRTRTYAWTANGDPSPTLFSVLETSTDGLNTWQTQYRDTSTAMTNHSQTVYGTSGSRTVTTTAPDGSSVLNAYSYGRLISSTRYDSGYNPIGSTTYTYDLHGRLGAATDARNGTTTYGYNNADLMTTNTTPNPGGSGASPQTTITSYNNMLQAVGVQNPDNTTVSSVYLLTGELGLQYGSRIYPMAYSFDYAGRMQTMTNWSNYSGGSGARVTTWKYDGYRGFLTNKVYDGSVAGPSYSYTAGGRLASRVWARGITTTYGYNNAGDLATVNYSDGTTPNVTNTYDRLGRLTQIGGASSTESLTYNLANELLGESYSGGTLAGLAITNRYDAYLRRTNLAILNSPSSILASTTYGYDSASRLSIVTALDSGLSPLGSAQYSYVANSPLVGQIVFKQNGITRMTTSKYYDNLNRLMIVSSAFTGNGVSFSYGYNSANQRTNVNLADGSYWVYQYDSLGQVTSGKKYWADGTPVAGEQLGYTFDNIGNRTQTQSGGDQNGQNLRSANYSANNLNQITSRDVPGYVNILGASTATTVTVNSQSTYRKGEYFRNELFVNNASAPVWQSVSVATNGVAGVTGNVFVPQTQEQFSYDADGNLTTDGRFNYTWDAENQLISLTSLSGAPTGSKVKLDFAYDAKGRRIQKIVSTNNGSAYVGQYTNRFVYDGWNLIAEVQPNNSLLRSYIWGLDLSGSIQGAGGVSGLLEVSYYGTSTTNCFPAFDGNGNVMAYINTADGTSVAQFDYDPFLNVTRSTVPMAYLLPFLGSTKYYDWESGMYYYGYRYLKDGRWPNHDPIGERGGINLYAFVNNNALSRIDGLGLCTPGEKRCKCQVRVTPYGESPSLLDAEAAMKGAWDAAEVAGVASEGVGASSVEGGIASGVSAVMGHASSTGNLADQALNVINNPGGGMYSAWTLFTYEECRARSCFNLKVLFFYADVNYWGKPEPDDPQWGSVSVDQHHTDFGYTDGFASKASAQAAGDAQCAKMLKHCNDK